RRRDLDLRAEIELASHERERCGAVYVNVRRVEVVRTNRQIVAIQAIANRNLILASVLDAPCVLSDLSRGVRRSDRFDMTGIFPDEIRTRRPHRKDELERRRNAASCNDRFDVEKVRARIVYSEAMTDPHSSPI